MELSHWLSHKNLPPSLKLRRRGRFCPLSIGRNTRILFRLTLFGECRKVRGEVTKLTGRGTSSDYWPSGAVTRLQTTSTPPVRVTHAALPAGDSSSGMVLQVKGTRLQACCLASKRQRKCFRWKHETLLSPRSRNRQHMEPALT